MLRKLEVLLEKLSVKIASTQLYIIRSFRNVKTFKSYFRVGV